MSLLKPKPVYAASKQQYTVVEMLKYLGMLFTSDGRRNKETDQRIGRANTILLFELYRSVVTKQKLSNTAKLEVVK